MDSNEEIKEREANLISGGDESAKTASEEELQRRRDAMKNLAGPSLASKALARVRKLRGLDKTELPPKVHYVSDRVKERIRKLEEEFAKEEAEAKLTDEEREDRAKRERRLIEFIENYKELDLKVRDPSAEDTLFFNRAKDHIDRYNREKKVLLLKMGRNFKLFIIIILAFVLYYVYSVYSQNNEESSLRELQDQLPLQLDSQTTLQEVVTTDRDITLKIIKRKESFNGSEDINESLDRFVDSASQRFCRIKQFERLSRLGTVVKVSVDADDGSFHREFSCGDNK
ncbi:MAG: hypothetical protein ACI4M9_01905 [Succinivibrio sp.]